MLANIRFTNPLSQGGSFVSNNGYMWDHVTNSQLSGYFDKTTYTTDEKGTHWNTFFTTIKTK